jgi:hypothetical protein
MKLNITLVIPITYTHTILIVPHYLTITITSTYINMKKTGGGGLKMVKHIHNVDGAYIAILTPSFNNPIGTPSQFCLVLPIINIMLITFVVVSVWSVLG